MNEEFQKSLLDLIDETILEIEELKKSRFSASEIEIKGPGEGIDGKPSNGKLDGASKGEDKKDEKKDEDEKCPKCHKNPCECEDMDKGENEKADPDAGHHKMDKGENEKADPDAGHHKMDKAEKSDKEDKKDEKKEDKKDKDEKGGEEHEKEERKAIGKLADLAGMKKSEEDMSSLMKSFVEERVKPLEDKLSTILDLVNKIAEQPVAPKGATSRTVPLMKSVDEGGESLSKAQVASKLFELKKSGTAVDSLDVTKAEMGQDLETIVKKYKLS